MKKLEKYTPAIYFLTGVLFFIAAIPGGDLAFFPIGCCFIALGAAEVDKRKRNDKKGE